jgi:hypothetical protein
MANSVTITATSVPDGTPSNITLTKTGDDTGSIALDGQSYDLTNITASTNGQNLNCNGPLGTTISATVTPGNPAFVTVQISGFIIHSTKHYQLSAGDQQKLTQFIIAAQFPPLVAVAAQ